MQRYVYLTSEDFGYKQGVAEEAKYSTLGKIFSKGLEKYNTKEGPFKRLKNVEDKNEEQLKAIKDQEEKQLKVTMDENKTRGLFLKSICNVN